MAPAETVMKIERNPIYQRYFLRKWRRVFAIKQSAFPHRYDFDGLLSLSTISAMTDRFVADFLGALQVSGRRTLSLSKMS